VVDGFLPPEQLFLSELPGLRAVAFERFARELHILFGEKQEAIIKSMMEVNKIDRLEATIKTHYYYDQMRSIYANEAEQISAPIRKAMFEAMECEKSGNINRAIQLFESVIDNGFPPSTPYERLRIIYTKQGFYQEAIRVCKRYIEILEKIKVFWVEYPNIKLIQKYKEYIRKLELRIKPNIG
jgi:tetratricopeptide (TPR) repeat protein